MMKIRFLVWHENANGEAYEYANLTQAQHKADELNKRDGLTDVWSVWPSMSYKG